jgi:hypothetical protein
LQQSDGVGYLSVQTSEFHRRERRRSRQGRRHLEERLDIPTSTTSTIKALG